MNTRVKRRYRGRTIYRDVAQRYIQRHGGTSEIVQTAHDDCEVYLVDGRNRTRGLISPYDKFTPKRSNPTNEPIPY